ncbi:hypothetical protein R1sor_012804 [Riccia sorocarpa]|uniref:Uncharacterized protein n=1 Tax=Riccia sorocarpa TaxID=122646 RepID=A0ABD3I4W5_9MARC
MVFPQGAPPLGLGREENLPADFAGTKLSVRKGRHVEPILHAMASSRSKHSSTLRKSPDGDGLPEAVKERLLHMDLEKGFLEERMKVLE